LRILAFLLLPAALAQSGGRTPPGTTAPAPTTPGTTASPTPAPTGTEAATPGPGSIAGALDLPSRARDLRNAGVAPGEVETTLKGARSRGVPAGETAEVLDETAQAVKEHGPIDNFGAFVQAQLDAGLRGKALADAIRAEHAAHGKGHGASGEGKGGEDEGEAGEHGKPDEHGKSEEHGKPADAGRAPGGDAEHGKSDEHGKSRTPGDQGRGGKK
jgi:hypothetical protein